MKKLVLIGAGGYAKSVIDSIDHRYFNFVGFVDHFKSIGSLHLGYPILANTIDTLAQKDRYVFFVSIGNNKIRKHRYSQLLENNCEIVSIIDRSSIISPHSYIGIGVFVGKMAIINNDVEIGCNTIINTKSLIEHGCRVGSHSNISTNTTLNGDVVIEDECFVGSSSVLLGQLHVGKNSIIGAGSVVLHNVNANSIVAGVPARFIREID